MAKMTRRKFLKNGGLLSLGVLFGLSKFGDMGVSKAAVGDNSASTDISDDIIYCEAVNATKDVFKSGQKVSVLAKAVNQLNENFSNALASLKDTAVAKAINAAGSTFPEVIEELGAIPDKTGWYKEATASDVSNVKIMIPQGYHDGTGYVDVGKNLQKKAAGTLELSAPTTGTDCTDYAQVKTTNLMKIPTANKEITANGENIDVTNFKTVKVNVSPAVFTYTQESNLNIGSYYIVNLHSLGPNSSGHGEHVSISGCDIIAATKEIYSQTGFGQWCYSQTFIIKATTPSISCNCNYSLLKIN